MLYMSTRGQAPELEFGDVLLAGLASDGGLYIPKTWPPIEIDESFSFKKRTNSFTGMVDGNLFTPFKTSVLKS